MNSAKPGGSDEKPSVSREDIMERSASAFEAVVAIAREARRLNAVPGVYLNQEEKAIPRAVKNFVDGRVDYEVDWGAPDAKRKKRGTKSK